MKDGEHLKLAGLDVIVLYVTWPQRAVPAIISRREGFDERRYAGSIVPSDVQIFRQEVCHSLSGSKEQLFVLPDDAGISAMTVGCKH